MHENRSQRMKPSPTTPVPSSRIRLSSFSLAGQDTPGGHQAATQRGLVQEQSNHHDQTPRQRQHHHYRHHHHHGGTPALSAASGDGGGGAGQSRSPRRVQHAAALQFQSTPRFSSTPQTLPWSATTGRLAEGGAACLLLSAGRIKRDPFLVEDVVDADAAADAKVGGDGHGREDEASRKCWDGIEGDEDDGHPRRRVGDDGASATTALSLSHWTSRHKAAQTKACATVEPIVDVESSSLESAFVPASQCRESPTPVTDGQDERRRPVKRRRVSISVSLSSASASLDLDLPLGADEVEDDGGFGPVPEHSAEASFDADIDIDDEDYDEPYDQASQAPGGDDMDTIEVSPDGNEDHDGGRAGFVEREEDDVEDDCQGGLVCDQDTDKETEPEEADESEEGSSADLSASSDMELDPDPDPESPSRTTAVHTPRSQNPTFRPAPRFRPAPLGPNTQGHATFATKTPATTTKSLTRLLPENQNAAAATAPASYHLFSPSRRAPGKQHVANGLAAQLRDWLVGIKDQTAVVVADSCTTSAAAAADETLFVVRSARRAAGFATMAVAEIDGQRDKMRPETRRPGRSKQRVLLAGKSRVANTVADLEREAQEEVVGPGSRLRVWPPSWEVRLDGEEEPWTVVCDWGAC